MLKERTSIFARVLLMIFLLAFPHFSGLPYYSYAIICFGLLVFYLKKQGMNLKDLGLIKSSINTKMILTGILSGIIWAAFMQWFYVPAVKYFFNPPPYTEYNFIQGNLPVLIFTLLASWIVGGFYEEVIFRGFLQTTFMGWLGNNFWLAAFITSTLFGLYHIQQGLSGLSPEYWVVCTGRFYCTGQNEICGRSLSHMQPMIPLHSL